MLTDLRSFRQRGQVLLILLIPVRALGEMQLRQLYYFTIWVMGVKYISQRPAVSQSHIYVFKLICF